MRKRKFLALLLCLSLSVGLLPMAALAEGSGDGSEQYVLMNIPYADFYAAELGENGVDAVTAATLAGKARNVNVNGASYHQSEAAVTEEGIAGATFPVKATAEQLSALEAKGAKHVTDADAVSYEMNVRGKMTPMTLEGPGVLQESPSYSYYVLDQAPASYKELTVSGDTVSFGKAVGTPGSGSVTGEAAPGRHADVEISLSGAEIDPATVSGVIVSTASGSYALHHVVNVWRGTEIGWNLSDMDLGGQTITKVTYFLKDGTVTEYSADIAVPRTGYVLMNIPYADFYAAELGENGSVDAVSGATLKYANSGLAGGSYHDVDAADADSQVKALGVTYPVYVSDMSKLDASLEVKADTAKTIGLVTGREKTITATEVTGQDTLFCAPSYSWMKLADKPARYKTATAEGDAFTFGAVSGRATTVADVTGAASYYTHHGNYVEVRLNGVTIEEAVNGVLVTFDDGSVTALPHVQGFWQKTQIGWASSDAVAGKTITNVRFITANAVYDCPVEIPVKLDGGSVTAAFEDANTLTVTGLPDDIKNPVATVQTQVGRGETPTVIADGVPLGMPQKDGSRLIVTTDPAVENTTYTVIVTSDNYADTSDNAYYCFLSQVKGEYQPLFEGATFNSEYDHYWHDYAAAVVGESNANDAVASLKAFVSAPDCGDSSGHFFCGFTHDVATITFGGEYGKTVTFTKKDGSSVTRTYEFVKEADASGMMTGNLYQAQEAPADEFQYLLMFPDTPETTYHLEFRYAETEEDVENLMGGPYALWDASAIRTSALTEENEETLQNVISLFVAENMASETSDETNTQRAGLVGTWDFTDSTLLKEFGFDSMYIVLSADGTGKTYKTMNGSSEPIQVSEYTFFAYDPNKNDGKDGGTYIAMNPAEETVTPGEYEIKTINGRKALVFKSNEGEITYYLRTEQRSSSGGGGGGTVTPATNTVTTVTAENGSVSVSADKAKSGDKVTVTVKPNEGYKVDTVKVTDKNGKEIPVTDNGDVTYTYTMPASAVTVTPGFVPADQTAAEPASSAKGFVDVPADAYFAAPVDWAVEKGITSGVDNAHFAPDASCTRAQMVTFLWRAAGSPVPASQENPFSDVAPGAYYYDAVLWAVEKGITTGTAADAFSPNVTVDRAQSVTFLYRLSGEKTDGENPFSDVSEGDYFYDAVLWAVSGGVTNGTSANAFSPNADCTRGQIVTLLHRSANQ